MTLKALKRDALRLAAKARTEDRPWKAGRCSKAARAARLALAQRLR